jgi:hypothetical protein
METDFKEMGQEGVDWVNVAECRAKWRAAVNTVRNLKVDKMRGVC